MSREGSKDLLVDSMGDGPRQSEVRGGQIRPSDPSLIGLVLEV